MSTALVTTLRESTGYLRDDGYDQTASLMAAAADELERLSRRVQVLEAAGQSQTVSRRSTARFTAIMKGNWPLAALAAPDPRRHHET
jgi:hypothetical protein